jgi:ribosomal protein S18 acetylase RimI-like enzyme
MSEKISDMTQQKLQNGVREATEFDTDSLSKLASSTFIETYDDLSPEESTNYVSEFFTHDKIQGHIRSPDSHLLVADEGSLVGYILLERANSPDYISMQCQVECVRLFVKKSAQGRNWGSRLLDEGLRISEQEGHDALWLKVWDKNENAIRYYKKKGFRCLGEASYTEGGMNDRVIIMGRSTKLTGEERIY